jgi:hypothetical protein
MPTTLNRRERKAAQLLAHYTTCEKLAIALGTPPSKADGRKISIALFKLEKEAHKAMEHACSYPEPYFTTFFRGKDGDVFHFAQSEEAMREYKEIISVAVARIFGYKLPPGFFVNRDPRGYTLKIDPENKLGALLIADAGLHTDCGGYGILSPELNGD